MGNHSCETLSNHIRSAYRPIMEQRRQRQRQQQQQQL